MAPNIQFLILLLGISIPVGHAKPPNKIVKGENAPHTPYQVSLFINQVHICGGSIIDKRHIITAAHCVSSGQERPDPLWILVGTNDQTNRNQNNVYGVVKTFIHEAYSPHDSWRNDIAILKVDRDIIFNEYQRPIPLPISDTPVGTPLTLTGWGETRNSTLDAGKIPRYLRTITTYVVKQDQCQWMMNIVNMKEGQICTWTRGKGGACKYDSGGPLVDGSGVLVGVVSFGNLACTSLVPDVFTRVYHYVPWIQKVITQSWLNGD